MNSYCLAIFCQSPHLDFRGGYHAHPSSKSLIKFDIAVASIASRNLSSFDMHIFFQIVFLVLAISVAGCRPKLEMSAPQDTPHKAASLKLAFTQDLISTVKRSDKIIVSEHSFEGDFVGTAVEQIPLPEDLVYEALELTDDQTAVLMSMIEEVDKEAQASEINRIKPFGEAEANPACIFAPHHTIVFMVGTKRLSRIDMCFSCGQIRWDGSKSVAPLALVAGMSTFIKYIGLQPERDWESLARQNVR